LKNEKGFQAKLLVSDICWVTLHCVKIDIGLPACWFDGLPYCCYYAQPNLHIVIRNINTKVEYYFAVVGWVKVRNPTLII